jgi:hypothetical protein
VTNVEAEGRQDTIIKGAIYASTATRIVPHRVAVALVAVSSALGITA